MTAHKMQAHGYPPRWKVEGELTYETPFQTVYTYDQEGKPKQAPAMRERKVIPMIIHGYTLEEVRERYARLIPQICPKGIKVLGLRVYNTHIATLEEIAQKPKSFEEIEAR